MRSKEEILQYGYYNTKFVHDAMDAEYPSVHQSFREKK
jgi:hypothetical protein